MILNRIVFLIILSFPTFLFSQIKAKVIGIKDGDTIVVLLDGDQQKTLRLAEVDCPESGQPFGKNSKQFTSNEVFGKFITYFPTDIDRYGRTIAKIYYDNEKYLSEEIIKNGLGWWYFYFSKSESLGTMQKEAENKKLGLWIDAKPISPWEWRKISRER
ncbi:thermonuclease family protein [Chryseobacterium luteum]|uniref:Nuclease n=1 Tax=Chryseobacterium luteum TaxID=421531 RepID=A0A085ZXG7_9FLAO|nr:thermonuclease family protein [Chryseobacterium luteum]KFF09131.1 nuclease [Chryseobacterium luteum]